MRLIVFAILAGCIEPSAEVVCGDLICPPTSVCLANQTCASHDDAAACDGLVDGAGCTTPMFTGTCRGGACFAPECGDGFVEGSEQCDGSVGGIDCVDFGFDLGVPSCDSCVVDVIGSCIRFGWRPVLAEPAQTAWTDGTRFGVIRRDQTGVDFYNTADHLDGSLELNPSFYITGNAHSIVAGNNYGVSRWDGTSVTPIDVTTLALSPSGTALQQISLGTDDVLYARTTNGSNCTIAALAPSTDWKVIRSTPASNDCQYLLAQEGQVLLAVKNGTGANVLRWNGTTWSAPLFSTTEQVQYLAVRNSVIYAATGGTVTNHVVRWDAGTQLVIPDTVAQVIPLDSGIYGGGGGFSVIKRYEAATWWEAVDPPIGGTLITDGTKMYAVGNGIYVYSGEQFAARTTAADDVHDLALFTDGTVGEVTLVFAMTPLAVNFGSWNYFADGGKDLQAIAGTSANDFYVSDGTSIDHFVNTTPTAVTVPGGTTGILDLWVPPSGATLLYAVGANQLAMKLTGTTWTPITPPAGTVGCTLEAVTGDATQVLAAGTCGTSGVIWQLTGTTWTELRRTNFALAAITVDPAGDIYAVGLSGGTHEIAGTWSDDPAALGVSVAATATDDVWVAGGPGIVIHWDGATWSRLGVIGASKPRVVATPREVTISGTSDPLLLR